MPVGVSPLSAHVFGSHVSFIIALPVIPSLTPVIVALKINASPMQVIVINR